MAESTRPLPPLHPLPHGGWEVQSLMSSADYTIRGLGLLPPNSVVPVIVVPGIMGTNLRARRVPRLGRKQDERNGKLEPGEAAWRAPNDFRESLHAKSLWERRTPLDRQQIFDASTLEVDDGGSIALDGGDGGDDGYLLDEAALRQRGWGEVHAESYGRLLLTLQTRLNQTFGFNDVLRRRFVHQHWKEVMALDTSRWGASVEALTEEQLAHHARHYFPVYAVGYNWLEDCALSARRLEQRIGAIVAAWVGARRQCDKVILVTHSMGGLVARACAQRIPDRIAGVIHGVMPAHGTPVVYRRLACGTEDSSPGNGALGNGRLSMIATVLGRRAEDTVPVLAMSPGALELLPNHRYQGPWLQMRTMIRSGARPAQGDGQPGQAWETQMDCLQLPGGRMRNPYDLYRDMAPWYRMIDPLLADPAKKFRNNLRDVKDAIVSAIDTAERFHRTLDDYYHPHTYVFHGADQRRLSYGRVRWTARQQAGSATVLTPASVAAARLLQHDGNGRRVQVEGRSELDFEIDPQDAAGDGTVPQQSGAAPGAKVRQVFASGGFDHQYAFNDERILMLTQRLIARIVQELP